MFRLRRVPPSLDQFVRPLQGPFHWAHVADFRRLVLTMAVMWGRRNVANLARSLEAPSHRPRFNNVFLVARGAPEAALRQQAQALRRGLQPRPGETGDVLIADAKQANRGRWMAAVAKRKAPVPDPDIRGPQDVCAILGCRGQVIPWGIRLSVKAQHAKTLGRPFRKPPALAAHLIQAGQAPRAVKVVVLCEASSLWPPVATACRAPRFRLASTLKRHRRLFTAGWKLKAGR